MDQRLRDDVRMLGELLGETLRLRGGERFFETVERVRALAKRDADVLPQVLRELPVAAAVPVARAFSHFLALANIAEQHHRVRRRREYQREGSRPQPGSCEEAFARIISSGVSADALARAVSNLRIELVFTAHPTDITRRTIVQKHLRIADALAAQDRPDLTIFERDGTMDALRCEVVALWGTDDVRPRRPTPHEEIASGLLIFEQTVWNALPAFLRTLDRALRRTTSGSLEFDRGPIITFGSWIGGDRDGNPLITPEVTRYAVVRARDTAVRLYRREIEALRLELSMTDATPELRERAGGAREPYRALMRELRDSLPKPGDPLPTRDRPQRFSAAILDVLRLCCRSLSLTGQRPIVSGRLADLVRRTTAFGDTLVRLDVRQHAKRHAAALAAVTRARGEGDYGSWEEAQRQAFLRRALRDRLAIPSELLQTSNDEVRDVFETLRAIAELPEDALGAYIISMTENPSDVLAAEYLQRQFGSSLRVVPLFEEVDTLHRAGDMMRALYAIPEYAAAAEPRRQQEVMIGYSDSAKDGGRLAANWELYQAQEAVVAACRDAGTELTLFHGRGGSIGRGGGPTYLALRSQPPSSIQGRLRVTVQGEMIQAQFGLPDIAQRTLEVYTTATLDATLSTPPPVPQPWRDAMDRLAHRAHEVYRDVVYNDPRFVEYFRAATPEQELGAVPIGSRPARRPQGSEDHGVESLRAIPWVFAWTQTRLLLPSWLGTGEALGDAIERGELDLLRTMYRDWPFFGSTITLIEMAVAQAEPRIAAEYDRELVPDALRAVGESLRARLDRAATSLVRVIGASRLLEGNDVLRRLIELRNPYVDPINLVQIEVLRRLREGGDAADQELWRAFMVTANGIAAGMRNVG